MVGGDKMTVYHGSTVPVEKPMILKSERMLDFGQGFYATYNKEQAIRWSQIVSKRQKANSKFITEYEFNLEVAEKEIKVISFDKPDEEWLDFVCLNRNGRISSEPYDIAIGPVANDQVYATVVLYEQGVLSKEAAIIELKVRELYNQVLFHNEQSLKYCRYNKHIEIGR